MSQFQGKSGMVIKDLAKAISHCLRFEDPPQFFGLFMSGVMIYGILKWACYGTKSKLNLASFQKKKGFRLQSLFGGQFYHVCSGGILTMLKP